MMLERSIPLIGEDGIAKLAGARVLVVGAGGVGCAVIEALARAGVGHITVCDGDVYSESNLNRQLFATVSTLGLNKAEVSVLRIKEINPGCHATAVTEFYGEHCDTDISGFDHIADCIDSVPAKALLITRAVECGVDIISCMGAGNKLDPMAFEVRDISKTEVCPLAKAVRLALRKNGINKGVKALFSRELPYKSGLNVPASISFVPPAAGLCLAGEIIKDIISKKEGI